MKRESIAETTLRQQVKQEQWHLDKIDMEIDRLKFARDAHFTSKGRLETEIERLRAARLQASEKRKP
jgi:hypothetical protein